MITITPLCPICLNTQTPCERKIWTLRGTTGPIETYSDIYLIGTIIGINKNICLGSAFIGRLNRRDILEISKQLYNCLNFKTFYAYRQPTRTFLMGEQVNTGFFKGSWKVNLKEFNERFEK